MSENISLLKYFISGGIGGVCTILAGHPLDTIKVRLQTMPVPTKGQTPLYRGTWDCFTKTVQNEGILGLYKGMSAPITAVAPMFAISFFSFGLGKNIFKSDETKTITNAELFAAGCFSGFFTSFIMAPSEHIKSLMQIQNMGNVPQKYKSSFDCLKQLYLEGIRHIYKGLVVTMLRDVPASGAFYMTYEIIKRKLMDENESTERKSIVTILAGGLAGVFNWVVAMPNDVLKTRLQTAPNNLYPNGISDVFKELMAREGPTALYKGFTPVMIRAFVANAACFVGFELTLTILNLIVPYI